MEFREYWNIALKRGWIIILVAVVAAVAALVVSVLSALLPWPPLLQVAAFAVLSGLGLLALYMILASLFNSFTHPFTIMMSAPLSFIGGFLALKVLGMSLDMMSCVGLLVLMGLVMKNGILLVDYTNQLREAGRSREEAILEAGPVRMRPATAGFEFDGSW